MPNHIQVLIFMDFLAFKMYHSDVEYIIVFSQYCTLVLSMDSNYEFTSGTIIPYLTYWTYAQMDV